MSALADGGDGGAARARLVAFIDRHPGCAEAHNDLGVLAYQAGDLAVALAAIDKAIALRADCARYHRNRALVLLSQGALETALVALSRALSIDPEDADTLKVVAELETVRRQNAPRADAVRH